MRRIVFLFLFASIASAAPPNKQDSELLASIKKAHEQIKKAADNKEKNKIFLDLKAELSAREAASEKNATAENRKYRMSVLSLNQYFEEIKTDKISAESCARMDAAIRNDGEIRDEQTPNQLFGEAEEALRFLQELCPPYAKAPLDE